MASLPVYNRSGKEVGKYDIEPTDLAPKINKQLLHDVVLMHLARAGLEVFEYPPARVKSTVAGHGRADKGQVVRMMQRLLALEIAPREDAADALALAFTYVRRAPIERVLAARTALAR